MAFFASPAKKWLKNALEERAARAGVAKKGEERKEGEGLRGVKRAGSTDSLREPVLGLPSDPQREIDDAINEIRGEIEEKRRLMGIQAERVRNQAKASLS
jgi:lysophospholipid acyltransferase